MREATYKLDSNGRKLTVTEQTIMDFAMGLDLPVPEHNKPQESQCRIEYVIKRGYSDSRWFAGLAHTDEASGLVAQGWADGAKKLDDLRQSLGQVPAAKSRRRKPVWADSGDNLDVDRALAGQWDSAYRIARRDWARGPQVVDLCVPWGGNCGRTSDELFWQGAVGLALADILEQAGYSVRLLGAWSSRAGRADQDGGYLASCQLNLVTLKDAGESLRIDAVASILCHAGVMRSLGFRALLQTEITQDDGLGRTTSLDDLRAELKKHGEWPENAVIVPSAYTKLDAIGVLGDLVKQFSEKGEQ